nr:ribonuclease H-like domain-containing protein [Tanacetum cinerariifolium]
MEFLKKRRKFFAAKRTKEKRNRPPTQAQQRKLMCTYLKNMGGWKPKALKSKSFAEIQKLFEKAMARINNFVDFITELVGESTKKDKAFGDELKQEKSKKQKVEDVKEQQELKRCLEIVPDDEDDVTLDATPLSSKPPTIHECTKHIEIDIHFVRNLVAAGQVRVLHVPSRYQFANILSNGLPSALFEVFRTSLSIRKKMKEPANIGSSLLFGCEAVSNQNTQQALALPEKEMIHPHLPVRLSCYDFTPVTSPAFGIPLLAVKGKTFKAVVQPDLTNLPEKSRKQSYVSDRKDCWNLVAMELRFSVVVNE